LHDTLNGSAVSDQINMCEAIITEMILHSLWQTLPLSQMQRIFRRHHSLPHLALIFHDKLADNYMLYLTLQKNTIAARQP
jgi:hypothetical protein